MNGDYDLGPRTIWRDVECPKCEASKGRWCIDNVKKGVRDEINQMRKEMGMGPVKKKNMPRRPQPHVERLMAAGWNPPDKGKIDYPYKTYHNSKRKWE